MKNVLGKPLVFLSNKNPTNNDLNIILTEMKNKKNQSYFQMKRID